MAINHDTENTICKLNLKIQNITTELQGIKIFVKEQFYLIKKSTAEIHHQSEPQRNKEFTELQQQKKNLVEENKSKTTTIQMLIENQNLLNKVDLESNSTKKFEIVTRKSNKKQSIHKADKTKCSNRYETLDTDDNDDESCNSYDSSTSSDEISDKISSGNMEKKKNRKISTKRKEMKRKDSENVIKEKDETTK